MPSYWIIIIPLVVYLVTQGIKITIKTVREGFKFSHFVAYGGMPSAHVSFITSAVIIAVLLEGIDSAVFILACVMWIIIVRDAVGIRMHLSDHSKVLNLMVNDSKEFKNSKYPHLGDRLGHTIPEAIVGFCVGVIVTVGMYLFLGL